jgi:opacity protein-like surface antigen
MRRMSVVRWAVAACLVAMVGLVADAAVADEPRGRERNGIPGRAPADDDGPVEVGAEGPESRARLHVGVFGGRSSGGTSVGVVENLFFITDFRQGSDATFGGRVGYALGGRFRFEAEYARTSPGLEAVLTDTSGLGRTEIEFSDLDISYLSGGMRFNLSESRIQPFLRLGLAYVTASGAQDGIDDSSLGIIYGAGVAARIAGPLSVRGDVRGLRSKLEIAPVSDTSASNQLLWSVGVEIGF